mgnify:CR=1 FL=1
MYARSDPWTSSKEGEILRAVGFPRKRDTSRRSLAVRNARVLARRLASVLNHVTLSDEAGVEAKGLAPIQPFLNEIKALGSKAGYPDLVARTTRAGVYGPVIGFVGVDDKVNTQYALTVYQGGLGMPDRDYYLVDNERNRALQGEYKKFLAFLLGKAGYANPEASRRRAATQPAVNRPYHPVPQILR